MYFSLLDNNQINLHVADKIVSDLCKQIDCMSVGIGLFVLLLYFYGNSNLIYSFQISMDCLICNLPRATLHFLHTVEQDRNSTYFRIRTLKYT